MDESKNLAGFVVVILVFSNLFSSRCTKRGVLSETEIHQKNQWWEDDSHNYLVEISKTFMEHFSVHKRGGGGKPLFYQP